MVSQAPFLGLPIQWVLDVPRNNVFLTSTSGDSYRESLRTLFLKSPSLGRRPETKPADNFLEAVVLGFQSARSLLLAITILMGGTVVHGDPQHQSGIAVFPNVVRAIDRAGGNFILFLSHTA